MLTARFDAVGVLKSCRWLLLKMSFSLRRERKGDSDQGMNDEWKEQGSIWRCVSQSAKPVCREKRRSSRLLARLLRFATDVVVD